MTYFHPDRLEGQRQRWMRPDWQRYVRPDWRRYVKPGYELDHWGVLVESKAEPEWQRKAERMRLNATCAT